jgi:replicative DNA helicase
LKDISKASKQDYGLYGNSWSLLRESELYINDDPNITINKIKSICRRQNSKKKLDYVVIDHSLLLVQDRNSEREELSQMSAIIRKMSKEMNTVVIFVSQLNYRDGKATRPHKGMLKGSGSLGEDADLIIFPWRPFEVKKEGNPEDACLVLGKARAFESKDIPIRFCTISTGFYDLSEKEYLQKSANTNFYFEEHKPKTEEEPKPKKTFKPKAWEE